MEIFIKVNQQNQVTFINYQPFDAVHGMKKTREELLSEGYLVNNIPDPEVVDGKVSVLMYNPDTSTLYFEYKDRPLTESERLNQLEDAFNEFIMGGV